MSVKNNSKINLKMLTTLFNALNDKLNKYEKEENSLNKEEKIIAMSELLGLVANLGTEANCLVVDISKLTQKLNSAESDSIGFLEEMLKMKVNPSRN